MTTLRDSSDTLARGRGACASVCCAMIASSPSSSRSSRASGWLAFSSDRVGGLVTDTRELYPERINHARERRGRAAEGREDPHLLTTPALAAAAPAGTTRRTTLGRPC